MNQTSYLLFASCAPGLEPLLGEELRELGLPGEAREGGWELRATSDGLYRLALGSALAEGVRVRLKSFVARDFGALVAGLSRLPWRAYLRPDVPVRVRVTCHRSKLWHSGAVEERVLAVLRERVGVAAPPARAVLANAGLASAGNGGGVGDDDGAEHDEPATVFVRITGDAVQVSVDAAGRLHRRGYRTHVEKASLRETLAAALVRVAHGAAAKSGKGGALGGGQPAVLWDPFCGAGTIVCEAARAARGLLPGALREFPFQRWPTHAAAEFAEFRAAWTAPPTAGTASRTAGTASRTACAASVGAPNEPHLVCMGSDVAQRALEAARHNAELAGVAEHTRFLLGDFAEVVREIPEGAWIVTNPPYGERLEQAGLMKRLASLLESRRDLRPVVVLVGGAAKKELPGHFQNALTTKNGGLDVSVRVLAE